MQPSEVRKLAPAELAKKETELRERVVRLTLKRNARRLDKPTELVDARHDLARVLTVRNERARADQGAKG
ncbi:MAG: 50S ribosomal protein L29 [Deltaproteobacteria bacterium]|nr:50S ribosomal protein L29 [Deltaproteobacteria bacterium]